MTRPAVPAVKRPATWWGERWLGLLGSLGWTEEVLVSKRARQILKWDLLPSEARGVIRSAEGEPAVVSLTLEPLPARTVEKALRAMAKKASFAASLLSGRLPEETDAAFADAGQALFPEAAALQVECDRDPGGRCEHAASVHARILLEIDQDPFVLFLLRGVPRDAVLLALKRYRASRRRPGTDRGAPVLARLEPLPDVRPELFFKPLSPVEPLRATFTPPEHPEAVLHRLGPAPLHDPEAARLLTDLHRAIGLGAAERLEEWEWRRLPRTR